MGSNNDSRLCCSWRSWSTLLLRKAFPADLWATNTPHHSWWSWRPYLQGTFNQSKGTLQYIVTQPLSCFLLIFIHPFCSYHITDIFIWDVSLSASFSLLALLYNVSLSASLSLTHSLDPGINNGSRGQQCYCRGSRQSQHCRCFETCDQPGGEGLPCPVCCRLFCQWKDAECSGPVSERSY